MKFSKNKKLYFGPSKKLQLKDGVILRRLVSQLLFVVKSIIAINGQVINIDGDGNHNETKVLALIPTRLNSARLPAALLPINNLPLVMHVYKVLYQKVDGLLSAVMTKNFKCGKKIWC